MLTQLKLMHLFCDYLVEGVRPVEQRGLEARNENLKKKFQFITDSPLTQSFRCMLRYFPLKSKNEGNDELETVLYGNNTEPLEELRRGDQYQFPTEDKIREKFVKLNKQYSLFQTKEDTAYQHFKKFFIAAKFIADYDERNNTPDNDV